LGGWLGALRQVLLPGRSTLHRGPGDLCLL